MNPLVKFSLDNFKELLRELGRLNKPEYLFELEDKVIEEIAIIASQNKPHLAKAELLKIKAQVIEEVEAESHIKPMLKSFRNSVEGAVAAALYCL